MQSLLFFSVRVFIFLLDFFLHSESEVSSSITVFIFRLQVGRGRAHRPADADSQREPRPASPARQACLQLCDHVAFRSLRTPGAHRGKGNGWLTSRLSTLDVAGLEDSFWSVLGLES